MPDREKVIEWLGKWKKFGIKNEMPGIARVSDDAIALLKEHKEHEELLTKLGYHWTGSGETLALCKSKDGEQK